MEKYMEDISPRQIERRTSFRIPVRIPVIIEFPCRTGNYGVRGVTRDLSFGGTLLENTGRPLPEGFLVRLLLDSAPDYLLIINAQLVRSNDHGLALMFADYGYVIFDRLAATLENALDRYLGMRPVRVSKFKDMPLEKFTHVQTGPDGGRFL